MQREVSPPVLRRPRLAILGSRGIPARYGGFETFVEELAPRLVARELDVTVYCELESGPRPTEYAGVRLEYVSAWAPGPARTIQFDVSCLRRAAREHDIVYLLGCGAAFAAGLPRLSGARVWLNPGGLEWRRSKWGRRARVWLESMERMGCRLADRMIFDNAALAREISARHGVRSQATIAYGAPVLSGPLDVQPLEERGLVEGGYDLVVCRFEPENHLLEIVRAHARAASGVPLVVVSNDDLASDYVAQVKAAAGDETRFLGTVYDPSVLGPLRQGARVYLHGHSVGGTNPSLLESMGAGTLVLAQDNPFNREVLGAQDAYWDGEEELARQLSSLDAADPARLRDRARSNRSRVARVYAWDGVADAYAELARGDLGLTAPKHAAVGRRSAA